MNKPNGFTYTSTGDDLVIIHHHGRKAATIKGKAAVQFNLLAETATDEALQLRMAKLTGNYKRGNERRGK